MVVGDGTTGEETDSGSLEPASRWLLLLQGFAPGTAGHSACHRKVISAGLNPGP